MIFDKVKIIRVTLCGDDDHVKYKCPFFKRTRHYDYNDVCSCILKDWYIPQFKRDELSYEFNYDKESTLKPEEYDYIGGQIPDWCPLHDVGV